jgi:hypothetical protein
MATRKHVQQNVQAVQQALGVAANPKAGAEAVVLQQVERLLQPAMNLTWPSGLPENE